MGINIIYFGETMPITVRCTHRRPRLQILGDVLQTAITWLWWSIVTVIAGGITVVVVLDLFGYAGGFNWLINAIYGASTIIMKMVGWS